MLLSQVCLALYLIQRRDAPNRRGDGPRQCGRSFRHAAAAAATGGRYDAEVYQRHQHIAAAPALAHSR
jgi:hypothetical protein